MRAKKLEDIGIMYMGMGVSGGEEGARNGERETRLDVRSCSVGGEAEPCVDTCCPRQSRSRMTPVTCGCPGPGHR